MKTLNLVNIAKACNGELKNISENDIRLSKEASSVVIDSRLSAEGSIFIATPGERTDGHKYIPDVANKGALGVVCEKAPVDVDIPYILVKDSFEALKKIACFYRDNLNIPIVGITGSVGKTSTKEFIAGCLSAKYNVLKTKGNHNNEIGVPLTLLSIMDDHEIAVVEMGISDFGEMDRLTAMVKPDTCVITNIGQCHLEKLIDRDGVLKAKTAIFKSMNPKGAIFLNGDDDKLRTVTAPYEREPVFFGISKDNDIYPENLEGKGLLGSDTEIVYKNLNDRLKVHVPLPGQHMVANALVAAAVGCEYGLSPEEIKKGIESVASTSGRSNVIKTDKYILIDDCYNANPVSMKSAIDLLMLSDTRRVAILGDMFELGENEEALHAEVGRYAREKGVDALIAIGELSENLYRAFGKGENVYHYPDLESAFLDINNRLKTGDSILLKASHGMHFEKLLERLK